MNSAITLTVLSADPVKTNGLFPVDWKHAMAETFFVCPEQEELMRCEKAMSDK